MRKNKELSLIEKIDELVSLELTPIKDTEFTADTYMKRLISKGVETNYDLVQKKLKRLVNKKILTSRSVRLNGMRVNAYSFVDQNHQNT